MKQGVWANEGQGKDDTSVSGNEFIKFSNGNSDPIAFFDAKKTAMRQATSRTPNRLGLGINVFNALKVHPAILERVKFGGTTANPANVTENVLAQLFGVDRIVIDQTVQNKGKTSVIPRGSNKTVYVFRTDNTQMFSQSISTADMITRVKVVGQADDDGRTSVEATVNGETKYGIPCLY